MIFRNPDMKLRLSQIRNVAGKCFRVLMKALAHQDPSHVRPPFAIHWRMWVAFFVRKLMMNSMSSNPENWAAFER